MMTSQACHNWLRFRIRVTKLISFRFTCSPNCGQRLGAILLKNRLHPLKNEGDFNIKIMGKYLNKILEAAYNGLNISEQSHHNFSNFDEYLKYRTEYKEDLDSLLESNLIKEIKNSRHKITLLGRQVYKEGNIEKHLKKYKKKD